VELEYECDGDEEQESIEERRRYVVPWSAVTLALHLGQVEKVSPMRGERGA
jgi:hypothetical protein